MARGKRSQPEWVLASASPRRSAIMRRLGMQIHVAPSKIPEPSRTPRESPARYAVRVARLKAEEVAQRHPAALVVSADTIVVVGHAILGKPSSRADAQRMLQSLSGRWHEVLTGICLLDTGQQRIHTASSRSRVHFRRMAPSEIRWYLNTEEYRDKAGAYGVQGYASLFIDRIEGCYFNIVGFPIATFAGLCRKAGIRLIRDTKLEIPDFE